MFLTLKSDYFQLWFLLKKVTRAFQLQEHIWELSELDTFKPKKTTISSTLISQPNVIR